jgi:hypothetical protein
MKLGHTQGRFEMGAFSDSYVLRVLLATPTRARNLDTVARQWRWLRTSLVDPYRSELYNMRGPGPKWRKKHGRCAGCYNPRAQVSFTSGNRMVPSPYS